MFSDTNINKTMSVILLLGGIAGTVTLSVFHIPIPETLNLILGVAVGYASHSLGVTNGVAAAAASISHTEQQKATTPE